MTVVVNERRFAMADCSFAGRSDDVDARHGLIFGRLVAWHIGGV
jgi:hypothetical protein